MPTKLTLEMIRDTAPPESGTKTLWDGGHKDAVTGFGIRVYASGKRSFFLNYRVDGYERRYTIGEWPTWSLGAARDEAKDLRKRINRGDDPAAEKRERREAPTVGDLIARYVAEHLPTKTAGQSRARDEVKMLELIGDKLGHGTKVADIHAGDIQAMHQAITNSGRGGSRPVGANRILGICSKMFSLTLVPMAGENEPWRNAMQGNPCRGVKRNPETAKGRLFSQAELAAITDAIANYGADARGPGVVSAKSAADCIRLIMLTGCRPAEARIARWAEFDREPGFWVKPSAHTKQRREHRLPLSAAAIELISRMRAERKADGEWMFPGQLPGQPLKQLWAIWHYIRDVVGLGQDSRVYDLRHTFASLGAGGGLNLPIIGKLLGHTQARTTERYAAHLADDPVRAAADKIAAAISNAGKGADNVVRIKDKAG
jgi:integrase